MNNIKLLFKKKYLKTYLIVLYPYKQKKILNIGKGFGKICLKNIKTKLSEN